MRLFRSHKVRKLNGTGRPVLVIRIPSEGVGLFCHFNHSLSWMRWADGKGYLSYVDMRHPQNLFHGTRSISYNPWEIFFKQPCDAHDLVCASELLTNEPNVAPPIFPGNGGPISQEDPSFLSWRRFAHEHIALSDEMMRVVDERQRILFKGERRVLGCLVRGTDYVQKRPSRHPVQPSPRQVVEDAKLLCARNDLSKVFLATEDRNALKEFEDAFGDDLIVNQTELPSYTSKSESLVRSGAMGDEARIMEISRQYFVSIALLSRCTSLLAGQCSGSIGAAILSNGYEVMNVYDLGLYS